MPLIPCITNSAPGASLYALSGSGGGGGGAGPNLSVSSLSVNNVGGVQCRYGSGNPQTGGSSSAEVNFDHDAVPNTTTTLIYDPSSGVSSLSVYLKGGSGYNPGTLNVANIIGVSSLTCSTINGVVPGAAAIPADLTVSTLTIAGSSPADGSLLNVVGLSPSGVLFNYVSSATTFAQIEMLQSVNGGNGGVKLNGGQDAATITVGNNVVSLTPDAITNNNTLVLEEGKGGKISLNTTIGSGTVSISATSINATNQNCDLQISSINGRPASNPIYSTLGIPGGPGASFSCTLNTTNQLITIGTTTGNTYELSVGARTTTIDSPTDIDSVISEVYDSSSSQFVMGSWPASQVSTMTQSSYYQQVGGTVVWKAESGSASFAIYPTVNATTYIDSVRLIDFGTI